MLDLESLFKLSYPMCIICSKKEGKINGCIVNTVFQIVPEPPMIAFSINKDSLTYEYIADSKVFTVSVLAEGKLLEFIGRFGFKTGRDIDKFEQVRYKIGQNGVPIILDNVANYIEAEVLEVKDAETHTLCISKITACESIDDSQTPMTYTYIPRREGWQDAA